MVAKAPRQLRNALKSQTAVTWSLIATCVIIWVLQIFPGSLITQELAYWPLKTVDEPWRMLTAGFLHSTTSPIHLFFNMYSLWVLGRMLEPIIGPLRFLGLYLISIFGGSVAALWMLGPVDVIVGASGAIFGLMAAVFVVARSLRQQTNQLVGVIAINFLFGFLVPGIAWQAHLGGLLAGAAVGWVYSITRGARDTAKRRLLVGAIVLSLIVATVAGSMAMLAKLA